MLYVPAESKRTTMSLVPHKKGKEYGVNPNCPETTWTPVIGDICQYFLSCEVHPALGCPGYIETPMESDPKKDIFVPAQILLLGVLVKLAFAALLMCMGYALE